MWGGGKERQGGGGGARPPAWRGGPPPGPRPASSTLRVAASSSGPSSSTRRASSVRRRSSRRKWRGKKCAAPTRVERCPRRSTCHTILRLLDIGHREDHAAEDEVGEEQRPDHVDRLRAEEGERRPPALHRGEIDELGLQA